MLKHLDGFTMKVICPQFPFLILEDEVTVESEQITLRKADKATKLNRSMIIKGGGLRSASVFCDSSTSKAEDAQTSAARTVSTGFLKFTVR